MKQRREIVGGWSTKDGRVVEDANCTLIMARVRERLERIGSRDSGWVVLYRDPEDESYWELSYPQGSMEGGGPPSLAEVFEDEIVAKYGRGTLDRRPG